MLVLGFQYAALLYVLGAAGALLVGVYGMEAHGTGQGSRRTFMARAAVLAVLWPAVVVFMVGMIALTLAAPGVAQRVRRWIVTGEA